MPTSTFLCFLHEYITMRSRNKKKKKNNIKVSFMQIQWHFFYTFCIFVGFTRPLQVPFPIVFPSATTSSRSCRRVGSWVATCCATPWRKGIFWPTSGIPTLYLACAGTTMGNIYLSDVDDVEIQWFKCPLILLKIWWSFPSGDFHILWGAEVSLHCCLSRFGAPKKYGTSEIRCYGKADKTCAECSLVSL